jgi:hypothetical protein
MRLGRWSGVRASLRGSPPAAGTTQAAAAPAHVGGSSDATYAMVRPSGEKSGCDSAAPVRASGFTSPVATSTVERSARVQSSALGVGTWEKAIVLPSGDQWMRVSTLKDPFVSSRGSPFAAGTTQIRVILKFSSTTVKSVFSFLARSSASSGRRKAIHCPSGDGRNPVIPDFTSVSCSASPPSTRIFQRLLCSPRLDVK